MDGGGGQIYDYVTVRECRSLWWMTMVICAVRFYGICRGFVIELRSLLLLWGTRNRGVVICCLGEWLKEGLARGEGGGETGTMKLCQMGEENK